MKISKTLVRITVIAAVMAVGISAYNAVPQVVQTFLPVVETISASTVEYCETVTASGNIYKQDGIYYMSGAVGEKDIEKVKIGQTAVITGTAFPDSEYKAEVIEIAEAAHKVNFSTISETVVDVTLELTGNCNLRDGYTAQAEIEVSSKRKVNILPYDVIMQDNEGEYVYIVENNTANKRYIETGADLPEGAEIIKGVDITDEVINFPENIQENSVVNTIKITDSEGKNEQKE